MSEVIGRSRHNVHDSTCRPSFGTDSRARPHRCAEARLTTPVLVVEDEPHVRDLITLVLRRAGHEVVAVAGPHAALAALNRQPGHPLMLVDVVMPEMGGYDLVVEARTISPGIHVVFMSAFARDVRAASERRRLPGEAVHRRVAHRSSSKKRWPDRVRAKVVDVDRIANHRGRMVADEPVELGAAGLLGSQLESNQVVDRYRIDARAAAAALLHLTTAATRIP